MDFDDDTAEYNPGNLLLEDAFLLNYEGPLSVKASSRNGPGFLFNDLMSSKGSVKTAIQSTPSA